VEGKITGRERRKQADFRSNLHMYAVMDQGFEQMESLKNLTETGIREVKGW
jgi:hypothetical protein